MADVRYAGEPPPAPAPSGACAVATARTEAWGRGCAYEVARLGAAVVLPRGETPLSPARGRVVRPLNDDGLTAGRLEHRLVAPLVARQLAATQALVTRFTRPAGPRSCVRARAVL